MTKIDFNKLKIGDRLVRTKGGVFSKHHVLYMGYWNNQHLIAENQIGFGVRYLPLLTFLNEGKLIRVEYNNLNENSQTEVISRVNGKCGTKYSLFNYNCEHFVNEILTGIAESKQIKNAVALSIGFALCYLAFNDSKNK